MRGKENQKAKFMRTLATPLRVLSKAKDLYMKFMIDCNNKVANGGLVGGRGVQISQLPRSFGANSSKLSHDEEVQNFLQLVSKRSELFESNLQHGQGLKREVRQAAIGSKSNGMGRRSYSVNVGKIGKIDEERPCSFTESGVDNVKVNLCPRSRSQAMISGGKPFMTTEKATDEKFVA